MVADFCFVLPLVTLANVRLIHNLFLMRPGYQYDQKGPTSDKTVLALLCQITLLSLAGAGLIALARQYDASLATLVAEIELFTAFAAGALGTLAKDPFRSRRRWGRLALAFGKFGGQRAALLFCAIMLAAWAVAVHFTFDIVMPIVP